ncbi:MAG TPA: hypothetical protein VMT35_05885 [Ignavibacteriaceae bacterium]|nr:hypothetical protein [Ignavibacteriaceae bacterium]
MTKKSNNSIYPPGIKKAEVIKRARYLSIRLNQLFNDFSAWIKDLPDYKVNKSFEEITDKERKFKYKIPFAEIIFKEKKIASIKPAGLFAFGYNCRIEVDSKKGTGIIIDAAKEKDEPNWQLIPMEAGKNPKKVTKIIFRNLLKKLTK